MAIHFTDKEIALFKVVAKAAATLNTQAFAVGGFVRDKILDRPTKDIDIVCLVMACNWRMKLPSNLIPSLQ